MKVRVGKFKARGALACPPSKSMAHRLLICAGLSEGESLIKGVDFSDDVKATLRCLKALGAECEASERSVKVRGGVKGPQEVLDCGECGSTLRFFIPICLLFDEESRLTGSPRLMERPLSVYEDLCLEKGLFYRREGGVLTVKGSLCGGEFTLPADVSSQFISGLLFALPLAEGDSVIHLTGKTESAPYIDMTLSALAAFGADVRRADERTLRIRGGQRYKARELAVEGDFSNAAFFEAFNYIGGDVRVDGLPESSLQGDSVYRQYFPLLAGGVPTLDISDCPDLGPVLFALAACKNGGVFTGTARLRLKESDRGQAMAKELAKCGVRVDVEENRVAVGCGVRPPVLPLSSHNDHRIAMALTVLLSAVGGEIEGAEAVNKSLPAFYDMIKAIGAEVQIYE